MKVRVDINLKGGVLAFNGRRGAHALQNLGFAGVQDVRVGKTIELDLGSTDAAQAQVQAKAMAEQLLANQVIENYRINLV